MTFHCHATTEHALLWRFAVMQVCLVSPLLIFCLAVLTILALSVVAEDGRA